MVGPTARECEQRRPWPAGVTHRHPWPAWGIRLRPWRAWVIAVLLAAMMAPAVPTRAATGVPQGAIVTLDEARRKLSRIEQQRAAARAELDDVAQERAALEAELAALNDERGAAARDVVDAERALASTNRRLLGETERLRRTRNDLAHRRGSYAARSRVRLRLRSVGGAEVLLHADDIGELTRTMEFLRAATARDREAIAELSSLEKMVRDSVRTFAGLRDEQAHRRMQALAERDRLTEIVAEQEAVQAALALQVEVSRQLLGDLDAEHRTITGHVATLAVRAADLPVPAVKGSPAHGIINKRDGVHVWLRYRSPQELYILAVNRRDGALQIAKKTPGGVQNGGTYHVLARLRAGTYPIPFDRWQQVAASAVNDGEGSVELRLLIDGVVALEAVDDGSVGGPPLLRAGRVGIRGDNTEFLLDDVRVRHLGADRGTSAEELLDDFERYDTGMVTNQHPDSPRSPIWRMTSGSLFARDGAAWSGKPDYGRPGARAGALSGNNSSIFRLRTRRADLGDVEVAVSLRTLGMVAE